MDDFPTFAQFLNEYEVQEDRIATSEERSKLKKVYRKLYQKHYQRIRKGKEKRLENRLTLEEFRFLRRHANQHQQKNLSRFLKETAFAYLRKKYLPTDPQAIRALSVEVRRIGNNINQIVQVTHAARAYSDAKQFGALKTKINELHDSVNSFLNQPPEVSPTFIAEYLKSYIQENPNHYHYLVNFIESLNPEDQTKNV